MKDACGEGFKLKSLLVVGGGSRNRLWRQILADVMQVELRFPTEKESAALGAALQAGAAIHASRGLNCSIEDYVVQQPIAMEEDVVTPTTDEETLRMYLDGRKAYCSFSAKLFVDNT